MERLKVLFSTARLRSHLTDTIGWSSRRTSDEMLEREAAALYTRRTRRPAVFSTAPLAIEPEELAEALQLQRRSIDPLDALERSRSPPPSGRTAQRASRPMPDEEQFGAHRSRSARAAFRLLQVVVFSRA